MNIDNPRKILKRSSCNGKGKRKSNKDSLKVVYISSPMKVKTSAKRFRSLVQQLTGKNSDVWRYMEADDKTINGAIEFHEIDCGDDHNDESTSKEAMSDQNQLFNSEDTPTSSDTFLGSMSMDNVFSSQMDDEQFAGIFSSDSFFDSSQFDHVLGSYDELL